MISVETEDQIHSTPHLLLPSSSPGPDDQEAGDDVLSMMKADHQTLNHLIPSLIHSVNHPHRPAHHHEEGHRGSSVSMTCSWGKTSKEKIEHHSCDHHHNQHHHHEHQDVSVQEDPLLWLYPDPPDEEDEEDDEESLQNDLPHDVLLLRSCHHKDAVREVSHYNHKISNQDRNIDHRTRQSPDSNDAIIDIEPGNKVLNVLTASSTTDTMIITSSSSSFSNNQPVLQDPVPASSTVCSSSHIPFSNDACLSPATATDPADVGDDRNTDADPPPLSSDSRNDAVAS